MTATCSCGCGKTTKIARRTNKALGHIKGHPMPFLLGHRLLIPLEQRFWAKVDRNGPIPIRRPDLGACWLWTGTTNDAGYGVIGNGRRGEGLSRAHRLSYEIEYGPIGDGLTVDHLCFTPLCVNPKHLEAVPNVVNSMRGDGIGWQNARKTACPQGHPYNVQWSDGSRRCRECRYATQRARKAARHVA